MHSAPSPKPHAPAPREASNPETGEAAPKDGAAEPHGATAHANRCSTVSLPPLPPPLPHPGVQVAPTCRRTPLFVQAFSLLGALGEAEDVEEVDADVLAPEPKPEEEGPRMPQRPKRVSAVLAPWNLAGLHPTPHADHLQLCDMFICSSALQLPAPPKPRPPPDVSDRLTLDDRKFTRLCVF